MSLSDYLPNVNLDPRPDPATLQRLRSAAVMGDAQAANELGYIYSEGEVGDVDIDEAVRWFMRSAEQGDIDGLVRLGDAYFAGEGVEHNLKKAAACYGLAADKGSEAAKLLLTKAQYLRAEMGGYFGDENPDPDELDLFDWDVAQAPDPEPEFEFRDDEEDVEGDPSEVGSPDPEDELSLRESRMQMYRTLLQDQENFEAFVRGRGMEFEDPRELFGFDPNEIGDDNDEDEEEEYAEFPPPEYWGAGASEDAINPFYGDDLEGFENLDAIIEQFEEGNFLALEMLHELLVDDSLTPEQHDEVVEKFRNLAESKPNEATALLGACYYSGEGVERDVAEAVRLWQLALEAKDEDSPTAVNLRMTSAFALGNVYRDGDYGDVDYEKAFHYFELAANEGFRDAQEELADMCNFGLGVEQNQAEAVRWLEKASERGSARAKHNLGVCYYNGFGVEKDHLRAAELYRESAELGNLESAVTLGMLYSDGQGVKQDSHEAERLWRYASHFGNGQGAFHLAGLWYEGEFGQVNIRRGLRRLALAASLGYEPAMLMLVKLYLEGDDFYPQKDQILELEEILYFSKAMTRSAIRGIDEPDRLPEAFEMINPRTAVPVLRFAAALGNDDAMYFLGFCYASGKGVPVDKEKGLEWYRKAAAHGNKRAELALKQHGG